MNENCQKWHAQLKQLREKHAEFLQAYQDALEFAAHNHKARETAFQECRKLKDEIKPLIMEIKKEFLPSFKYHNLVNRLNLSPDDGENKKLQEKLQEMVSEENYNEAVATAKELDPNIKVPTHEEIIKNLLALGPVKLEKIATVMTKPGLIIVPDKSMTEIIDAMNDQRHYDYQKECVFDLGYSWSGKPGKVSVCIVDMVQSSVVVPGQQNDEWRNFSQLRKCQKFYRDNGMRLISDTHYAVAMQQSLRAYQLAKKNGEKNPEEHILDFVGHPQHTATIFNQEDTTSILHIAYGCFGSIATSTANFFAQNPNNQDASLRGRGTVQIM